MTKPIEGPASRDPRRTKTPRDGIALGRCFPFFIKLLSGSSRCLLMSPSNLVADIRDQLSEWEGFNRLTHPLCFKGRILPLEARLGDCGICKDATIYIGSGLRGGNSRSSGADDPSSSKRRSFTDALKSKEIGTCKPNPRVFSGPTFVVEHLEEIPSAALGLPSALKCGELVNTAIICRFNGLWPSSADLRNGSSACGGRTWSSSCAPKVFSLSVLKQRYTATRSWMEDLGFGGTRGCP